MTERVRADHAQACRGGEGEAGGDEEEAREQHAHRQVELRGLLTFHISNQAMDSFILL